MRGPGSRNGENEPGQQKDPLTIRRGGLRSERCTAWERCDSENPGRGDASQGLFARDRPDSR